MEAGMEQAQVFISYSRANSDFVLHLAKDLKAAGQRIWLDQLDIAPGARWDDELEKALQVCEIFMVILTPASMTSQNVKDEIGYAIDARKRIIPVLLENAVLPLRLRRFQYIDFTAKSYEDGVESAKRLLESLGREAPGLAADAASAPQTERKNRGEDRFASSQPAHPGKYQGSEARSRPARSNQRKKAMPVWMLAGIGLLIVVAAGVLFLSNMVSMPGLPANVSTITPGETPSLLARWMDVSFGNLGFVAEDDIGARFRATQEYSQKMGFAAGFPNFYVDDVARNYGTILLTENAIVSQDVPVNELGDTSLSDAAQLFRSVNAYAGEHGYVGGFPDFFADNARNVYGVVFVRPSAAEWRDVPAKELGNPPFDDFGAMFRAVHDYAVENGFVGGFPDFYADAVRGVYGVVLIKSTP